MLFRSANQPPDAEDDFAETQRNVAVAISVLDNDSDPDGDPLDPGSVEATQPARGGTVIVNTNGSITYTPKKNFRGTDTFTYTVMDDPNGNPGDGDGLRSDPATVQVNVVR